MSDELRKIARGLDATSRLARQMEEMERIVNPLGQLTESMQIDSHVQSLLNAEAAFGSHQALIASAFGSLNARSALFELAGQVGHQADAISIALEKAKMTTNVALSLELAILPDASALSSIAAQLAKTIPTIEAAYLTESRWADTLHAQMAAIQKPWALADFPALSFEGFAAASRLNIVLRSSDPFSEQSRELMGDDLGDGIDVEDEDGPEERDVAHIEAGMNASLLAFSPNATGDVLIQAGFVMRAEYAPIPPTVDGSDPGHTFHPGFNSLITAVEQNLRHLIVSRMKAAYGDRWLEKRVSEKLAAEWTVRREEAVEQGESPLHLIHYSNFMELKDVVIGGGHWKAVFEPTFKRREHFVTSMDRLHPIRRPLAHSRPIGRGQQFHLISEAAQILKALGIDIFAAK